MDMHYDQTFNEREEYAFKVFEFFWMIEYNLIGNTWTDRNWKILKPLQLWLCLTTVYIISDSYPYVASEMSSQGTFKFVLFIAIDIGAYEVR